MALDESAARALELVTGLLTAAAEGRAQVLDMRERVLATTTRFETDWALLRERARALLEQAAGQEQQLTALRAEAGHALDSLRERAERLQQQGSEDAQATQLEMDGLAQEIDEEGRSVLDALQSAETAESALEAGVREVEAELARVLGEADELLRATVVADVRMMEQAVEREAIELTAGLTGQWLPALEQKAYDLYTILVQAEDDVRAVLEASLQAHEGAADAVLRECGDAYADILGDLGRLGSALEELLGELSDFVQDGRQKLDDRKRHWDEAVRRAREGLRDALESLREVQQYLARFSFGR